MTEVATPGPGRPDPGLGGPRGGRRIAADRVGVQRWLLAALAAAAAVCLGVGGQAAVARGAMSPSVGLSVGALAAALAVLGLPSISVRLIARLCVVVSAAFLVRFGALSGSLVVGSQNVLAWLVGVVAVFVLTDRLGTDAQPGLAETGAGVAEPRSDSGRARVLATVQAVVLVTLAVVLLAVMVTPLALPYVGGSAETGNGPKLESQGGGGASLRSSEDLDMTQRPALTDEVMFTVDTDRATFWRGETFDQWDGRTWTRSQPERYPLSLSGQVTTYPDDLGAGGTEQFVQQIRIETSYADVVFAAPSAAKVVANNPVFQRADGSLGTSDVPFGSGATYRVTSRRPVLTEARLRSVEGGVTPPDVTRRFASPPATTARVTAAALKATDGAGSTYDKIRALERWMGARTEYSLDAPLSPKGVDVVDNFLFDTRLGWCEQVASSLVVLARANGIPARLATGFVPDERDPVTGRYIVRARDAHAWTEVWFPELGWVPFDPTADVPLAGKSQTHQTLVEWLVDHAVTVGLAAAVIAVLAVSGTVATRRWRRRPHSPRRSAPWAAHADARLDALGAQVGRPRQVCETASAYSAALAERYDDERLAAVGQAIDDAQFAVNPPSAERQATVDAYLRSAVVPEEPLLTTNGAARGGAGQ